MKDVFISYAPQDREIVSRIQGQLKKAGVTTWLDTEIKPGEDWQDSIQKALKQTKSGLLMLSPSAVNSPYVAREYRAVQAQNKPLYVALIDAISPEEIPWNLQNVQYIDLTQDFDAGIQALAQSITTQAELPDTERLGQSLSVNATNAETITLNPDDVDAQELKLQVQKLFDSGARTIRFITTNGQ